MRILLSDLAVIEIFQYEKREILDKSAMPLRICPKLDLLRKVFRPLRQIPYFCYT